jgi:tetratricopeptide (TPR) repeat protein
MNATKPKESDSVRRALAVCNERLGEKDLSGALMALNQAIAIVPQNADLLCYRGQLRLMTNEEDAAKKDFAEALRLAPRSATAHTGLARWHLMRGDLDQANSHATKALHLNPSDADARSIRDEIPQRRAQAARVAEESGGITIATILQKNRRFKNIHAGRRCFIIGNGPSTKLQDLKPLKDEITIAVNDFSRNPDVDIIRSDYWVIADPLYWEQPQSETLPVIQLAQEQGLSPRLFVPTWGYNYFSRAPLGPLIDCSYYQLGQATLEAPIDLTRTLPNYAQNVVIVALMLAFNLGCSPIYLIGVDHDILTVTEENFATYASRHSYKKPNASATKVADLMDWEGWKVARSRMIFQYEELKAYAGRFGFDVFDATRNGHLTVFPKVSYESLFSSGRGLDALAPSITPEQIRALGEAGKRLLDANDALSALAVLDRALQANSSRKGRLMGLQYLRALALARLGRYGEALIAAREDFAGNEKNRTLSAVLIRELENEGVA